MSDVVAPESVQCRLCWNVLMFLAFWAGPGGGPVRTCACMHAYATGRLPHHHGQNQAGLQLRAAARRETRRPAGAPRRSHRAQEGHVKKWHGQPAPSLASHDRAR